LLKLAWERYKLLGEILGDFQGRFFTLIFYFTIMVPFGLGARLFGDLLRIKTSTTTWLEREPVGTSLEDARRQG
jgi:hypothetical protein